MKKNNKVNIYIPTYNSEKTITACIRSLLNQSYKNISITIINDCSTDNTLKMLKIFKDKRLKILNKKYKVWGMDNLDYAFKQAKGDFAAIYHSNDIYHKDIIRNQLKVLQKNPDVKIVFTNAELFNDKKKFGKVFSDQIVNNRKYSYNEILKLLIKNYNFFVCQSAFFRPKFYKKHIKKWNNNHFGYSADLDTWLRFSKKSKIVFLKKILVKTSIGNSQMSVIEKNKLNKSDFFKVVNFHLKSSKIKLNNNDINNLYLLNQRDLTRQIINLFISKKYDRAYRLTKKLNFYNLFLNNKISKKLILIFTVKNLIIFSYFISKNFVRKIFIFLNQKFIT
jgi:glycosyltransferase involved in cell wall biosynthesis